MHPYTPLQLYIKIHCIYYALTSSQPGMDSMERIQRKVLNTQLSPGSLVASTHSVFAITLSSLYTDTDTGMETVGAVASKLCVVKMKSNSERDYT